MALLLSGLHFPVHAVSLTPDSTVHLTGFASAGYADLEAPNGTFNMGSFSPILHFQYADIALLESELEFELDPNGMTELSLGYLSVDLFLSDYFTVIVGKFLSPLGQFRQNFHPVWINKLPSAPIGFGHDGAAPVAEVGVLVRGGFLPRKSIGANYAAFVGNGPSLDVKGTEIDIETNGLGADSDNSKVAGGRLGVIIPFVSTEIGFSFGAGLANVTGEASRKYGVIGADFNMSPNNALISDFRLQGEYIMTFLGAGGTTDSEAIRVEALYLQAAYQWLSLNLEPVLRFGLFRSSKEGSTIQLAPGLNYLFASNIMAKVAYEMNSTSSGLANNFLFQVAYGF